MTNHSPSTPLKVVFAGTPEFAASSLKQLIEQQSTLNIDIVAVYTQPDRKAGRGQKLSASPVKELALAHDITVEQPETFRKSSDIGVAARAQLKTYNADVMIVAAYGLILPVEVLETPQYGCLNIHASLLPRWRGAAPIHRAILAGDSETGITIMQMDKGLDTGDMLYKVTCPIGDCDTTAVLHDKLATLGAAAISEVIAHLHDYQAKAEQQDDNLTCYAEKLSKEEGSIDWTHSAENIARQIRGMFPYPSTFSFINTKRVKVLEGYVDPSSKTEAPAGTIISVKRSAIGIACGSEDNKSVLKLTRLQFAGGKALDAEQIFQGQQLVDGDTFNAS